MKTLFIVVLSWAIAVLAYMLATGIQYVGVGIIMGPPLLVVVPLLHLPLLRSLRRRLDGWSAHLLMALLGLCCSLPLVLWPIAIGDGAVQDALFGEPGAGALLIRDLNPGRLWPFYMLYGVFGVVLGFSYAVFNKSRDSKS